MGIIAFKRHCRRIAERAVQLGLAQPAPVLFDLSMTEFRLADSLRVQGGRYVGQRF